MNAYQITSFSAFRRTTRPSWDEAVEVARRYASEGNLPSEIITPAGHRWSVWPGARPERMS